MEFELKRRLLPKENGRVRHIILVVNFTGSATKETRRFKVLEQFELDGPVGRDAVYSVVDDAVYEFNRRLESAWLDWEKRDENITYARAERFE